MATITDQIELLRLRESNARLAVWLRAVLAPIDHLGESEPRIEAPSEREGQA